MHKSTNVAFLCFHNSARSQMATALMETMVSNGDFKIYGAGVEPVASVHPLAIAAMDEIGIDISGRKPLSCEELPDMTFHYVFSLCEQTADACIKPRKRTVRTQWWLPDPATLVGSEHKRLDFFRYTRDNIRERIRDFLKLYHQPNWNELPTSKQEQELQKIHQHHLENEYFHLYDHQNGDQPFTNPIVVPQMSAYIEDMTKEPEPHPLAIELSRYNTETLLKLDRLWVGLSSLVMIHDPEPDYMGITDKKKANKLIDTTLEELPEDIQEKWQTETKAVREFLHDGDNAEAKTRVNRRLIVISETVAARQDPPAAVKKILAERSEAEKSYPKR